MDKLISITLTVNGKDHTVDVEPGELLVDTIREKMALTGTKLMCNKTGECGSCTPMTRKNKSDVNRFSKALTLGGK